MPPPPDPRSHPAAFYRREAAKLRKAAEDTTTPAVRERLLDLARDFDPRAEEAERTPRSAYPSRVLIRPGAHNEATRKTLAGEQAQGKAESQAEEAEGKGGRMRPVRAAKRDRLGRIPGAE
jgi:hypothetical protein